MRDAERDYNWAVAEQKPEVVTLGVAFSNALNDFNAGLDVAYTVVEAADQENLLPEVTLTEDEEDTLAFPIDAARSVEGGQKDVVFRLMQLFETIIESEFNLE
jgi:hypothetical protein